MLNTIVQGSVSGFSTKQQSWALYVSPKLHFLFIDLLSSHHLLTSPTVQDFLCWDKPAALDFIQSNNREPLIFLLNCIYPVRPPLLLQTCLSYHAFFILVQASCLFHNRAGCLKPCESYSICLLSYGFVYV